MNKNLTRQNCGQGAISVLAADFSSVEISQCKLLVPGTSSREGEETFISWQKEFAQRTSVDHRHWRTDFAESLLDEGKPLDGATSIYLTVPEGKLLRDMTKEEVLANWQDVSKAQVKEINGLYDLGCFQRFPRTRAHDIIDARWVITWKMIGGDSGVKCKLTVRGFKDKCQDFDTYAGATSRAGQRIVNAVAAESEHFILFSFDVSQAFAKGLAFDTMSKLTGTECRAVQFDVPKADLDCLKQICVFEKFNPAIEILTMLKPIYGQKAFPRAWRKKLHQVLVGWLQCRQLYAEPGL